MKIRRNPNRPFEIMNPKRIEKAVDTLDTIRTPRVRKSLAIAWGIVLWMIFSLILTVSMAFLIGDLLRSVIL